MRRLLVALVATFLVLSAKIYAEDEIVYFPDPYFKDVLVNAKLYQLPIIDLNRDGEIQYSEAAAYRATLDLSIRSDSITDLTGIKAFINAGNIGLERCTGITSIDLSGMVNLSEVNFNYNPNLKKLDFAGCINLRKLDCSESALNDLNLANCKNLYGIWLNKNALTNLNIDDCPKIQYLFVTNNHITNINLTQSNELKRLQLQLNLLASLNVSNLTKLDQFWVSDNKLTSLNIRNNNNIILTSFKSKNNPDLRCITVDDQTYSYNNWKDIDEWTSFSEDCSNVVNDNHQSKFKVYPNPANYSVTIEREGIELADLRILDISGRILVSYTIPYGANHIQFDISKLSIGNYILDINNKTKSLIIK